MDLVKSAQRLILSMKLRVIISQQTRAPSWECLPKRWTHSGNALPNVTISAGLASFDHNEDTLETLMKKADDALYAAKDAGRKCSVNHETLTTVEVKVANA